MFPLADRDLKTRSFPFVNISIIVLCAIVFIYELTLGQLDSDLFFYKFGLIPTELTHHLNFVWLSSKGLLTSGQLAGQNTKYLESFGYIININSPIPNWATVFTSMFIHGGWLHFLGNMLFLWVFGDNVEDRFGHFRYLLFYLACGIAASALQIAVGPTSTAPTIGASGAIAGVLGAYLLLYPYSRIDTLIFIIVVRIPAFFLLGFWFILQLFSGIGELGPSAQTSGVAHWAHIGGFLLGIGVTIIYKIAGGESLWPRPRGPGAPREIKYWRGRPIDY